MTLPILLRSFLSSFPLSICFSSVSLSLSTIDSRIDQSDSSESLVFSDNIAELWILVIPEKLDKFSRFLKRTFMSDSAFFVEDSRDNVETRFLGVFWGK